MPTPKRDRDAASPSQPVPPVAAGASPSSAGGDPGETQSGGDMMSTQFMVAKVQGGDQTRALHLLSQKIEFFLQTRVGKWRFPPGSEFGDLVSEVMIRILENIRRFEDRGPGSFWGWVAMIATNRFNDLWRRHDRDSRVGLVGKGASPDETQIVTVDLACSDDASATQIIRFRELETAERDCVARLPKDMREVYLYRRTDELSFAEISERMGGVNESTLRSHYFRARDAIRECLGKKVDDLGTRFREWQ